MSTDKYVRLALVVTVALFLAYSLLVASLTAIETGTRQILRVIFETGPTP